MPKTLMAEDTRFELVRLLHQLAFQACAIGPLGESSMVFSMQAHLKHKM